MLTKRNFLTLLANAPAALAARNAFAQTAPRKKVVATFSILGDLVKAVGGDRIDLTVLVGPGGDTHVYSPSAADARALKEADIVIENGLGFEGWMERLIASSGTSAPLIVASNSITPLGRNGDAGNGHNIDPHAWQNPANVDAYIRNIAKGLSAIDPQGASYYNERSTAYLQRLNALDGEIRSGIAKIPPDKRKIVTTHDAFGYYAKAYGLTFLAPQGISSDSEPSAKGVATLIRQIRQEKISALFLENISDPRLMQQIARETGAKIGAEVFSDSLSPPDGPAASYLTMMRHNTDAFVRALAP